MLPARKTVADKTCVALAGRVRVTHGANDCEFDNLAEKTVAAVRRALASVFNIPPEAVGYVHGKRVQESYRLQTGDQLKFLKPAPRPRRKR